MDNRNIFRDVAETSACYDLTKTNVETVERIELLCEKLAFVRVPNQVSFGGFKSLASQIFVFAKLDETKGPTLGFSMFFVQERLRGFNLYQLFLAPCELLKIFYFHDYELDYSSFRIQDCVFKQLRVSLISVPCIFDFVQVFVHRVQ